MRCSGHWPDHIWRVGTVGTIEGRLSKIVLRFPRRMCLKTRNQQTGLGEINKWIPLNR